MSGLSYGLNLTKKPQLGQRPAPAKRKTVFDDDSEPEDGDGEGAVTESISSVGGLQTSLPANRHSNVGSKSDKPPLRNSKSSKVSQYGDLSAHHSSARHSKNAQEIDPSIYDYDAAYDSIHAASAKTKPVDEVRADAEKRPKYMTNLLAAAEVRKRDQLRAKEKMLAKEREAEGDEFHDKEKFVTGAYKRQQEEVRKAEEAEKEKEEQDRKRGEREGGGMKTFYKELLGRDQEKHEMIVKAVEEGQGREAAEAGPEVKKGKSEVEMAKEKNALINEEGEIVDKRELLSAGLNPGAAAKTKSKAADPRDRGHRGDSGSARGRNSREDASKRFEEQLLGKRSPSPVDDSRHGRAAKSRKMEDELLAAMESP